MKIRTETCTKGCSPVTPGAAAFVALFPEGQVIYEAISTDGDMRSTCAFNVAGRRGDVGRTSKPRGWTKSLL